MIEANIKIIEELKSFIEFVRTEPKIRQLFTNGEGAFSRDRKLPLPKVVTLISNFLKRSLSIELREFFDILEEPEKACTKSAFCLQRVKLKPDFFQLWNQNLVNGFYKHYGDNVKRWKGFRLLGVDGSTNYLYNKPELIDYFGTHTNQHAQVQIPMARIMQIQDVLNEIIVWGDIYPIAKSEQQIMNENVNRLFADSLTLFDRGFPSFTLMYLMQNQEEMQHFLMRCRKNFCKEVKAFLRGRKTSKIVELKPNANAIAELKKHGYIVTKDTLIKVRMVKVKLSTGETEVLLTNLYDRKLYPEQDLKDLYFMRWKVETSYAKQKNQLQMEIFSGQKVICVKQDYYATIFISNLQSLIEKQSDKFVEEISANRKYDYKINKNVSWGAMKNNIVKLFLWENTKDILLYLQNVFEKNVEPVRPNRNPKRQWKSKRLKGKYQTVTNYKRAA